MKTLTYLHNCNCGDLVAALASMKVAYKKYGKKAIICQVLDVPGNYMEGLIHSVKDDKGVQVTMNRKMFDMLRPLLLTQDYIEDFQIYTDQKIDVNLPDFREWVDASDPDAPVRINRAKVFVGIPNGALPGWPMLAFPWLAGDISKPWVTVPQGEWQAKGYILINRTERYLCGRIDYGFLDKYDTQFFFVGTEREHTKFCKDFKLDIPRLVFDNFLELAQAMQNCRFFMGNQSFPWNLANAMGVPRLLEMFALAPNCQPFVGEDNFGFYSQGQLEVFFEELYNKKAAPLEQLSGKSL